MNDVKRGIKLFTGRPEVKANAVEQLQAWMTECDEDPDNIFDIGEPIVYNGIYLLVAYNVERVARDIACNVTCPGCNEVREHYCPRCDPAR